MGTEARIGLLLGATACLLAVMVDWVVEELSGSDTPQPLPDASALRPQAAPTPV